MAGTQASQDQMGASPPCTPHCTVSRKMLAGFFAAVLLAGGGAAWSQDGDYDDYDGRPEEKKITQKEFKAVTETKSSVEGKEPTEPPDAVHDMNETDEGEARAKGGVKVISGKQWKKESPEERDAHIRRIKSTMPANSHLVVTVPQGDVWLFPGQEDDDEDMPDDWRYQLLIFGDVLRYWTPAQRAAMPVAVLPDSATTQSDKHGSGLARVEPEKRD
jgi:hypothetical protein